jgi:predicted restriction endonuclease
LIDRRTGCETTVESAMDKKTIREAFRQAVFRRDGYRCAMCGRSDVKLDAHHITDRKDMPNGGYVAENGITLCDCDQGCHWKAEHHHATGKAYPGYSPEELYAKIGSDPVKAWESSEKL